MTSRLKHILGFIGPEAVLGPIFQKEVRTAGRRRSTYVLRFLYAMGLLVIAGVAFYSSRKASDGASLVRQVIEAQQLAPTMTIVIAWFQFIALILAAPVLAAGSICDERRARSLDVLMTTPMRAGQIVIGKLASRIVQVVILALLAMPVLLAVRVFGGMSAEVVLATSSVAISSAVLGAALAILFSVRQRRGTVAALFAILTLLLLQGGPSVVEGIRFHTVNEYANISSPYRENVLATCAPAAIAGITGSVLSGQPLPHAVLFASTTTGLRSSASTTMRAPIDLGPMWLLNTVYNLILAAGVTLYTMRVLRGAMAKTEQREKLLTGGDAPALRRFARVSVTKEEAKKGEDDAPQSVGAASERFREKGRQVSDNPVLWREVRQPTFGSRLLFRIVAVLTVLVVGLLYWKAGFANAGLHGSLALIGAAAVMFQSVFMTSGPYAGEREARTWDVLLTTPMSGGEIVRGKLLGALRGFWFIPAVVLVHFVIAAGLGYAHPILIVFLPLIYIGPVVLFTCTGQLFSLRFRKAVTAGALNLVVAACLWGVIWMVVLFLPAVIGDMDDRQIDFSIDSAYCLNPVALISSLLDAYVREAGARGRGATPLLELPHHNLKLGPATLVVFAVFGFHLVLGGVALAVTRLNFRAWSGRSS